jgi:DNA-binding MarR family transcriptional regulator
MKNDCAPIDDEAMIKLDNQVCFPVYSAANAVVRAYRPILDKLDLTYLQYLVMLTLWEKDGISVKMLGARLHLDSGTLTPLLKRLEAKGLVLRTLSREDERIRVLTLTEQGNALKVQAYEVPKQMACVLPLTLDEMMTLRTLCNKIIDAV